MAHAFNVGIDLHSEGLNTKVTLKLLSADATVARSQVFPDYLNGWYIILQIYDRST